MIIQAKIALAVLALGAGAGTYTVVTGDTLSGIAANHGQSLSQIEHDNPQIKNFNLIYSGQKINLGPPSSPSPPSPSALPVAGNPGGYGNVPGVPVAFATCVARAESSDNPRAVNSVPGYIGDGGGLYGFLTPTWQGLGYSGQPFNATVAQQKQAFSTLYHEDSGYPWLADSCPQRLLGERLGGNR